MLRFVSWNVSQCMANTTIRISLRSTFCLSPFSSNENRPSDEPAVLQTRLVQTISIVDDDAYHSISKFRLLRSMNRHGGWTQILGSEASEPGDLPMQVLPIQVLLAISFGVSLLSHQSSAVEQVLDILMDILSWEIAKVVSPCLPRGLWSHIVIRVFLLLGTVCPWHPPYLVLPSCPLSTWGHGWLP